MERYELWETRSGNLVGSYATKEKALSVVAKAVSQHGSSSAETIALTWETGTESKDLASGAELANWAIRLYGAGAS